MLILMFCGQFCFKLSSIIRWENIKWCLHRRENITCCRYRQLWRFEKMGEFLLKLHCSLDPTERSGMECIKLVKFSFITIYIYLTFILSIIAIKLIPHRVCEHNVCHHWHWRFENIWNFQMKYLRQATWHLCVCVCVRERVCVYRTLMAP